jgi:hypothetical protein
MIVAGGIVTLKPVGGIVSNNPAMAQAQIEAQQQREAQRQAQVDAMAAKLAAQHQANQMTPVPPMEKKWSVPYK